MVETDLALGRDCAAMSSSYSSRFLPTMRIRKKATMLARMTAMMPPAEAPPTSNSSSACRIDQEGEVGGGVARAAVGGDEDLGEDAEQEDRLDQDDDGDRARQVRQRDVDEAARAKPAPSISAASFCSSSSDCSAVSRISVANGSHCQATMMMTESSGQSVNQSIGCQADNLAMPGEQPDTGMHQQVLPDQRG